MGRETVAVCQWEGQTAEIKLHLDSRFLQLRGEIRADIPRDAITNVLRSEEGLHVLTDGPVLIVELNDLDAERWCKAILKKPPTLAEKLGICAQSPAYVLGAVEDAALSQALEEATVSKPEHASILVAVLMDPAQLNDASNLALVHPDSHIWMVHEKGKAAGVGDTMIRTHMRERGFVDSKTSAVSDRLTATRYRLRKP